jgi:hypothetical protein
MQHGRGAKIYRDLLSAARLKGIVFGFRKNGQTALGLGQAAAAVRISSPAISMSGGGNY